MIIDQHKKQIAEIEALLARSRNATGMISEKLAARTAQEPLLGATRIAPRRVDPVPPPAPQRDRFMDAIVVRLRTRG